MKGLLSGLRRILTTDSSLKLMKNAEYFMLNALFFLELFAFFYRLFFLTFSEKGLDKRAKVNFNIYDVKEIEKSQDKSVNISREKRKFLTRHFSSLLKGFH